MQRIAFAPLLSFIVLLAACGTVHLSYNHADWLISRTAARYVDLTDQQAQAFKTQLTQFHAWHRSRELPRYAEVFDEAALRLSTGLSRRDVEWAMQSVRMSGRILGEHAGEDLAPVVRTLSDRQLDEIQRQFAEDNRKFVKTQMGGERVQLTARRADWLCGQLEDWVGELSAEQRARAGTFAAASADVPRLRLEERKRRQEAFLTIVHRYRGTLRLESELAAFLRDPDAARAEVNRQAMLRWERQFIDMLVDLDRSLTAQQRNTAVRRLRAYAADFRQLASKDMTARVAPASALE